jgi:hypothetical protein
MPAVDNVTEKNRKAIQILLHGSEKALLTNVVQQATASRAVELVDWQIHGVGAPMGPATAGVYRVTGKALDCDQGTRMEVPWSVILKVISIRTPEAQPFFRDEAHPLYWKREALAYKSGLLDDLPGGLRAPRCYVVVERDADTIWLWLEDVRGAGKSCWGLEQYAHAAECLGRFNGAYLAERPMPGYPWLVRDGSPRGLLDYNTELRDMLAKPGTWQHPLVRAAFPVPVADRVLKLWDERETLLRPLDRVQHTHCHLDAWRGNIFAPPASDSDDLVLIDWAFPGQAALGTDPGDLFAASFHLSELQDTEPRLLDQAIFEGYLAGLQEAGWRGDATAVRFAFAAFCALKNGCFLLWLGDVADRQQQIRWERLSGLSFHDYAHQQARLLYYLLDLADEARTLLD